MKDEIVKLIKKLPSDRELEILDKSILAADPYEYDAVIKDLKRQINKMTKKVRETKVLLNRLLNTNPK
jgi:hypothetical protein